MDDQENLPTARRLGEGKGRDRIGGSQSVGTFNGDYLAVDPASGMLDYVGPGEGSGFSPVPVFTIAKKLELLLLLSTHWPNYSKCASLIGVSRQTVMNHYNIDSIFRAKCDAIRDEVVDRIEAMRMEVALKPGGSFDRMCVLNAHRKSTYDPDKTIKIQHEMSRDESIQRAQRAREVIDVEVVATYDKVKTKQRAQRAKLLGKVKDVER